MSTVFETVNHYVFEELRRLDALDPKDKTLGNEIERARAIGAMAKVAVDNAALAVEATRMAKQIGTTPTKLLDHSETADGTN